MKFDWEWLVQHICTPPYDEQPRPLGQTSKNREEFDQPQSCREVIEELKDQDLVSGMALEVVNQFELIAQDLDLHD